MTEAFRADSVGTSYSTRVCRRCDIAMAMSEDARGRLWVCPSCGRRAR